MAILSDNPEKEKTVRFLTLIDNRTRRESTRMYVSKGPYVKYPPYPFTILEHENQSIDVSE